MDKQAALDWFKGIPVRDQVQFIREASNEFNWSNGVVDIDRGLDWIDTDLDMEEVKV